MQKRYYARQICKYSTPLANPALESILILYREKNGAKVFKNNPTLSTFVKLNSENWLDSKVPIPKSLKIVNPASNVTTFLLTFLYKTEVFSTYILHRAVFEDISEKIC